MKSVKIKHASCHLTTEIKLIIKYVRVRACFVPVHTLSLSLSLSLSLYLSIYLSISNI